MPAFISLAIIVNAATVIVLPILCGSLWYITSSKAYIGAEHKNHWWENTVLAFLFILSIWGSYEAFIAITDAI
jgi:hypothetical protein